VSDSTVWFAQFNELVSARPAQVAVSARRVDTVELPHRFGVGEVEVHGRLVKHGE
jgi:hypothetical protein